MESEVFILKNSSLPKAIEKREKKKREKVEQI